jgi:deazaflavin-dependent oxidoreductase (nitroreductase family)
MVSMRVLTWFFSQFIHRMDQFFIRITGGRWTLSGALTGWLVVVLTTTGAKSGRPRSVPLVGIPDKDRVVLIASNYGRVYYPAWYHNLKANPRAELSVHGQTRAYIAHEAVGEARQRYWRRAVKEFPGYEVYKRRIAGRRQSARHIPIMVLEPVEG